MHPKDTSFNILEGFDHLPIDGKIYTLITGGGYLLAMKHWDLGNWDHSWAHKAIAILECCPVVGGIFALIEVSGTYIVWLCCAQTTLSISDQLSGEYFKSRHTVRTEQDLSDNALVNLSINLSQKTDVASGQRAQYVANLIADSTLRKEILEQKNFSNSNYSDCQNYDL
jgi:hypothetical protein